MLPRRFDFSLKTVTIGDSGVGKTSFLHRIARNEWTGESRPTLGVDFLTTVITTETHTIQLQLWDTAGEELFRSVTRTYYRGACAAFILFDVTNPDSFTQVEHWLSDLTNAARSDVVKILVGNKSDLDTARRVTFEEAEALAHRLNLKYFEVSAKTGSAVNDCLLACVNELEALISTGVYNFSPKPAIETPEPQGPVRCC